MLSVDTLCWFFLVAVAVGKEMTSCYKAAVYHIPTVKGWWIPPQRMWFFWNLQMICAMIHSYCLTYLGTSECWTQYIRWAVTTDVNRLLGIVKPTRTLGVNAIIEHLSSLLETAPETVKSSKTGAFRKKIRDHLRCVYLLCFKMMYMCYLLFQCLK